MKPHPARPRSEGAAPQVPCYKLEMVCEAFEEVPHYPLPEGYSFRLLDPDEADDWARIEHAAGEFADPAAARAHFDAEFGPHPDEVRRRCLVLTSGSRPVGTATAWFAVDERRAGYGRLHWVGIEPAWQGRGLSRPLVEAAVRILDRLHGRAYLTSQTTSWKAIKVYLDFGFRPVMSTPDAEAAWALMREVLGHPVLAP